MKLNLMRLGLPKGYLVNSQGNVVGKKGNISFVRSKDTLTKMNAEKVTPVDHAVT